ncbi:phasin family protein [Chitinimonas naiadis]
MSNTNSTMNYMPVTLIKAQLSLWLRTSELIQENREQWLALGVKAMHRTVEETQAEVDELTQAQDWQSLSTLPAHAFRRCMEAHLAEVQEVAEAMLGHQTDFAKGCQVALADWQKAATEAISANGNSMPLNTMLQDTLQAMGTYPAMAAGIRAAQQMMEKPEKKAAKAH